MPYLTLKLDTREWSHPIQGGFARLALHAPSPFIFDGKYETGEPQQADFENSMVSFQVVCSDDLRIRGFTDAYYVLTVRGVSYTFWVPRDDEPLFLGEQAPDGSYPDKGNIVRLLELVPVGGNYEPPPGVTVTEAILTQLANLTEIVEAIPEVVGDMQTTVYDTNGDGIVNHAALADTVPLAGVQGLGAALAGV